MTLELSPLPKTWLIDIDGTIFRHNAHLDGEDQLLPGVTDFFKQIAPADKIVLLSARNALYESITLAALDKHGLRYDLVLFDMPVGERILINDRKPSGMATAHALNVERDGGLVQLGASIRIVNK